MIRTFTAALMVLVMAACTSSVGSGSPPATPTDADTPPSSTPEAQSSASQPQPTVPPGHPAAGLALVQFPDVNSPASQVFVVDADGNLHQVTGLGGPSTGASRPAWSPDRRQLAFGPPKVGAGAAPQVGVVNADGTGQRDIGEGHLPQWSPDGTRILFEEIDEGMGTPLGMWVADAASGELTRIGDGYSPQWLPDSRRIGYQAAVEGAVEGDPLAIVTGLHIVSLDGGEPQRFALETEAAWSPDGSAVLLTHDGVVSLAAPDGSDPRELVNGWGPVWSPDASRILFSYDMNQDAIPLLALVDREGHEVWSGVAGYDPVWSPDGTRIAVDVSYPEPRVQVIDAESGELLWEVEGSQPAW
jgi:Tol biopolymer transport system component